MAANELNPLYRTLVGFDRIASLMDTAARLDAAPGYPPFNVEQIGEDNFRIELAVAGFGREPFEGAPPRASIWAFTCSRASLGTIVPSAKSLSPLVEIFTHFCRF